MLYLEKRKVKSKSGKTSTRYYIRGVCPYTGEDVRESAKTSDRGQAADVLAIRLEERRTRGLHGAVGSSTFAECVVHYLSKGRSDRFLDPILDKLGKMKMRDITDATITEFIAEHYPDAKPATVIRQVYAPISAVWNEACSAVPPMALPRKFNKPEIPKRAPAFAKHDSALEAVLKQIDNPKRRAGVLFMSFSGARSSEVAAVLPEDYDPHAGTIFLCRTKNDDPRLVALPPFVNEVVGAIVSNDPHAPLFDFPDRFAIYGTVKRATRRAGVKFLSPHKLGRHTFAARFLRSGNSLAALKEAGGWRSVNAVMVYAHLEKKEVDAAIRHVRTPLITSQSAPNRGGLKNSLMRKRLLNKKKTA